MRAAGRNAYPYLDEKIAPFPRADGLVLLFGRRKEEQGLGSIASKRKKERKRQKKIRERYTKGAKDKR